MINIITFKYPKKNCRFSFANAKKIFKNQIWLTFDNRTITDFIYFLNNFFGDWSEESSQPLQLESQISFTKTIIFDLRYLCVTYRWGTAWSVVSHVLLIWWVWRIKLHTSAAVFSFFFRSSRRIFVCQSLNRFDFLAKFIFVSRLIELGCNGLNSPFTEICNDTRSQNRS